jgi:fructan beta-fructosidase
MKHVMQAVLVMAILLQSFPAGAQTVSQDEMYRPTIHFTPKEKWMNDPNGLVFHKGIYHLFYQHHPYSSVWGPMHWGHATSTDLIRWKHEPIAIFPDSLGMIFSGSAVIDKDNTSGFGKNGQVPLVAIYTQHDADREKAKRNDYQNQSLAYSFDNGKTWRKYSGNPVLKNPGIRDFRDPKVMWHASSKKWIMSLAADDRIIFYSSPNLKEWIKESEFGETAGAHGGVWECPDLFSLDYNGKQVWVLIVNLNPGGPNKGSATQYFLGEFDGKNFRPHSTETKWLDYGPDEYAGITWENTGSRRIFIGWMSNWLYANLVPTETWRSAMTIPRELKIVKQGNDLFVTSNPVKELSAFKSKSVVVNNIALTKQFNLSRYAKDLRFPCQLNVTLDNANDFSITLSNERLEQIEIGYDKMNKLYYIDRSASGKTDFQKEFAGRHTAPRFPTHSQLNLSLVIDVSSVELFADNGLTVMTEIFFPNQNYSKILLQSPGATFIRKLEYFPLAVK